MGERWSQEQFEEHWYSVMPVGSLGVTVPCDCGEDFCHGWRVKVTHIPVPLYLMKEDDPGAMYLEVPVPPVLHPGGSFTVATTVTL